MPLFGKQIAEVTKRGRHAPYFSDRIKFGTLALHCMLSKLWIKEIIVNQTIDDFTEFWIKTNKNKQTNIPYMFLLLQVVNLI